MAAASWAQRFALEIVPKRRSEKMQGIIKRFTEHFCAKFPGLKERAAYIIYGSKAAELSFDQKEASELLGWAGTKDSDLHSLMGIGNYRFPILQLYDFIFTMEIVVGKMLSDAKKLQRELADASDVLEMSETLRGLKAQYFPPDGRPEFFQQMQKGLKQPVSQDEDSLELDATTGQQMGTPRIFDSHLGPQYNWLDPFYTGVRAGTAVLKTAAARSVASAFVLSTGAVKTGAAPADVTAAIVAIKGTAKTAVKAAQAVARKAAAKRPEAALGPQSITRLKNDYELACEEAYLLSFPRYNDIVALSQGLFRIFVTASSATNSFDTPHRAPRGAEYKRATGIDNRGHWINTWSGDDEKLSTYHRYRINDHSVFQPKNAMLALYFNHLYMRQAYAHGIEIPVEIRANWPPGHRIEMRHWVRQGFNKEPLGGGAIGRVVVARVSIQNPQGQLQPPPSGVVRVAERQYVLNRIFSRPEYLDTYPPELTQGQLRGGYEDVVEPLFTDALRITREQINAQMERCKDRHAIWACPHLADSMRKTKVDDALFALFGANQHAVWRAVNNQPDVMSVPKLATQLKCSEGATYYRRQSDGKAFSESEAILNGALRPDLIHAVKECALTEPEEMAPETFESA